MSDLPNHWATANLLDLADLHRGVTYTKADARETPTDGAIPVLRANNIQDRSFNLGNLVYVPAGLVSELQRIQKGDVVVATSSGSISVVGKAAQAVADMNAGFGAFCGLLRPTDQIEARYFGHFFSTEAYRTEISSLARGVNINNLKRDHFSSLHLPIAPLPEQTRIADKLDAVLARVDACRDRLDRVPGILKRFRQAVLAAATSGKLTEDWRADQVARMQPQVESGNIARDAAELHYQVTPTPDSAALHPVCWLEVALADVCLSITDGDHQAPPQAEAGIPFITISAINDGRLRLEKASRFVSSSYFDVLKESRRPKRGDILFSVTGTIGIPALVNTDTAFTFQRHIAILKPDHSKVSSGYLAYALGAEKIKQQALAVATGTAQLTIPLTGLRSFRIEVPPKDEQTEIVRQVETLFAYADRLKARYKTARTQVDKLTPALLAKAFRGELVPQDPNDEPAAALLARIRAQHSAQISTQPKRRRKGVTV